MHILSYVLLFAVLPYQIEPTRTIPAEPATGPNTSIYGIVLDARPTIPDCDSAQVDSKTIYLSTGDICWHPVFHTFESVTKSEFAPINLLFSEKAKPSYISASADGGGFMSNGRIVGVTFVTKGSAARPVVELALTNKFGKSQSASPYSVTYEAGFISRWKLPDGALIEHVNFPPPRERTLIIVTSASQLKAKRKRKEEKKRSEVQM